MVVVLFLLVVFILFFQADFILADNRADFFIFQLLAISVGIERAFRILFGHLVPLEPFQSTASDKLHYNLVKLYSPIR